MPSFVLTDIAQSTHVGPFRTSAAELGLPAAPNWTIVTKTLRGGRRDGVEVVEVDNGALAFTIVPTRGMGIWKGSYHGARLGWDSPVTDGPVHPSHVNLEAWGGLGWLDGFDELLARCGLESNGAPFRDGDRTYTLHGRIANLPAHYLAVHVDDAPPHTVTVEGHVDEARLFGPRFRLVTRVSTTPGSNRLVVRDEVHNLKDQAAEVELLYHWNFGPPFLEEGARFVAPIRSVTPRTPHAAAALGHYDIYGPPQPGFSEQVYFFELHGDGARGDSVALLRDRAGDRGVALRFATNQLPMFTLWKNTGGLADGYVTGLEPGLNLPNPRPFEAARGRVPRVPPGGSLLAETTLEVMNTAAGVAQVEGEIARLQAKGAPRINPAPGEPFAPTN
jgi:hypothetical protein